MAGPPAGAAPPAWADHCCRRCPCLQVRAQHAPGVRPGVLGGVGRLARPHLHRLPALSHPVPDQRREDRRWGGMRGAWGDALQGRCSGLALQFSAVRPSTPPATADPSEANLFYIPLMLYSYSSNTGVARELGGGLGAGHACGMLREKAGCNFATSPSPPAPPVLAVEHVRNVLSHLRANYPYWNRTGGRDHFYVSSALTAVVGPASAAAVHAVHAPPNVPAHCLPACCRSGPLATGARATTATTWPPTPSRSPTLACTPATTPSAGRAGPSRATSMAATARCATSWRRRSSRAASLSATPTSCRWRS